MPTPNIICEQLLVQNRLALEAELYVLWQLEYRIPSHCGPLGPKQPDFPMFFDVPVEGFF